MASSWLPLDVAAGADEEEEPEVAAPDEEEDAAEVALLDAEEDVGVAAEEEEAEEADVALSTAPLYEVVRGLPVYVRSPPAALFVTPCWPAQLSCWFVRGARQGGRMNVSVF